MNYTESKPSSIIQSLIQCYWIMDATGVTHEMNKSVLPDGCFDIVIEIETDRPNNIVITGIWDQPIPVSIEKNRITIGTRFYPAAIDVFFNCKVSEYKNRVAPFEASMLKIRDGYSLNSLWTLKSSRELIPFLDCHFVMVKMGSAFEKDILLQVQDKEPAQTVQAFAEEAGLSTRQLNRHYQNCFGISPKTYFSIQRFILAKHLLMHRQELSLSDVATESNYYDQAHFIKEFKRFSGLTPAAFLQKKKASDFYNTSG